jgi:predicted O-methyltransferase YrrM
MTEYQFTQDWFSSNIPLWEQLATLLPGTPGQRSFLEIGSFEGRSMVWIAENMMQAGDHLECIDTWEGGEEHKAGGEDMGSVEARFDHNCSIALAGRDIEVEKLKGSSLAHLGSMVAGLDVGTWMMDFIYIDGSHVARDVLTDACMAWPLLKQGGLLVFDDYMWGESRDILHRPRLAVDVFVNIFAEGLDIVHMGYQFVVRKK